MSLREKVESILMDNIYTCEAGRTPSSIADKILALVEEERCEWTPFQNNDSVFVPQCNWFASFPKNWNVRLYPYCPCCGKKIVVKGER